MMTTRTAPLTATVTDGGDRNVGGNGDGECARSGKSDGASGVDSFYIHVELEWLPHVPAFSC